MKLPITDQFLWDIYKTFMESGSDIVDFVLSSNPRKDFLFLNDNPVIGRYRRKMQSENFSKLIYHLKKSNFIRAKNLENKEGMLLTKEGIGKALRAGFVLDAKNKRKDGKWTMVIFDVPEKYKKSRDRLRSILQSLGFELFQKSVWVTPYDVSKKLEMALQMHALDDFVKIFLIEEV